MRTARSIQPVLVTAVAVLFWAAVLAVIASLRFGGDLRGFLFVGTEFRHPDALADAPRYGAKGYDGQFSAALATDPLLLRDETVAYLDSPRYRALGVALPLGSWIAALTSAGAAIRIYQWLCWLAALAAVFLAAELLREHGRSPWWALLLAPNAGLATAIMRSTTDGAGIALLLAALLCRRRGRHGLAVAALAAAALTREIWLVAALVLAFLELRSGGRGRAVRYAAIPVGLFLAVALWRVLAIPGGGLFGGSYDVPFEWVLQKVDQMLSASIKITSIELWGFLALIGTLGGLAAFGRREERLTGEEVLFLAFMVLSWTFSFGVYVDVYGYMRALVALPFLALLIAATQADRIKQLVLLLAPAGFAFVGLLMVRAEVKAAMLVARG